MLRICRCCGTRACLSSANGKWAVLGLIWIVVANLAEQLRIRSYPGSEGCAA